MQHRARPNGSPQEVVQHLTTRCGVPIEVAERLVPNQEGIGDSPRTALTPDALERYREVVREDYADDAVLRTVLLLLPLTGLRVSEICHLKKKNLHLDGDKASWTFYGKGDKERTVPLWRKARRVFEPYMEEQKPTDFLFPNKTRSGAISPATVQEACRHIAGRDESLRHLTPHVLRHTFATMALLNCHDIKRTQEILGHGKKSSIKIPAVMLRYLHPNVQENRGDLQHSKLRGAVAAKRNPEQTVLGGGSLVSSEIYELLKSGKEDMIPVPNRRNRVYVYSRRRDDVVEVSEDRAQTWLALRDASRSVSKQLSDATSNEVMRRRIRKTSLATAPEGGVIVPTPEKFSSLGLDVLPPSPPETPAKPKRASKAPAEPKGAGKAKKNPLETPMNDDWYWKAIYSNVPPGPSRAHPVAQRNGRASFSSNDGVTRRNPPLKLHFAKNGTPYVYENGRPKFISKAEAASIKAAARRNPDIWEQVIDPFSVSDEDREGLQPIARRNPNDPYRAPDVDKILTIELHTAETPFLLSWILLHKRVESDGFVSKRVAQRGKKDLAKKASEAEAIEKAKAMLETLHKRFPDAHAQLIHWPAWGNPYKLAEVSGTPKSPKKAKKNNHRVWDQIIDPFSVTEARTYGRQPIGRRNPEDTFEDAIIVGVENEEGGAVYRKAMHEITVTPGEKAQALGRRYSRQTVNGTTDDAYFEANRIAQRLTKRFPNLRIIVSGVGGRRMEYRLGEVYSSGRKKAKKNPDIWEQVIGPFSVSEEARGGLQPIARRNKQKSKAKRNGVVRVYEVK